MERLISKVIEIGGFVTAEKLEQWGIDSKDVGLLYIPGNGAPAFQFDKNRQISADITTSNQILDAQGDPVDVLDWWIGNNAWLGAAPYTLIGTERENSLPEVARAELPDD